MVSVISNLLPCMVSKEMKKMGVYDNIVLLVMAFSIITVFLRLGFYLNEKWFGKKKAKKNG